ncbi:MAG: glycosyltransferase family 2 protein [Planctomycetia bacterium]|nr:glycosyltransferase family 2 protein [Planctomycetia bacterium]
MGDNRIVVVLVNYFSEGYLRDCLSALAVQTLPADRTIVVDNGSDSSRLDDTLRDYPEVELLRMPGNVGFAVANNRAVAMARDCRWAVLLNVDAFPDPDWLATLMKSALEHPDLAFFGSKLVDARSTHLLDGTGDVYHSSGCAWRRDHGESTIQEQRTTTGTIAPCAAAAMYRRDCWEAVGGFDEKYFCYLEDVDLALRLHLAGYKYAHVPEAVVRHVGSAITGRRSEFSVYHGHRNLVWTYIKNMPGWLFWKYLPQHLLLNAVSLIWLTYCGRGRTVLRAKMHALRGLPKLWRQRKAIQRSRRISTREFDALLAHGVQKLFSRL